MSKIIHSKLCKRIIFSIMVLSMVAVGITSAQAANYPSYDFTFYFEGIGHWQLTNVANKQSTNSVTMKCTYAEFDGSSYNAVVVDMYNQGQCSPVYTFYEGTWHEMINYVYEKEKKRYEDGIVTTFNPQARVDAWCTNDVYGQGATFKGYWYPDKP